jgi:hypothetical protein
MENYEEDITKYPTPDKQYEGAMKFAVLRISADWCDG